jgi:hypothetical protein
LLVHNPRIEAEGESREGVKEISSLHDDRHEILAEP